MTDNSRTVFFWGALPPPVHGFSLISKVMHDLIRSKGKHMVVFGLRGGGIRRRLQHLPAMLAFLFTLLFKRKAALYIALSGGYGQALDALPLAICRLRKLPVFVHHHSFAYVSTHSRMAGLALRLASEATHIVLCDCMGRAMSNRYAITRDQFVSLPNCAFVEGSLTQHPERPMRPFTIGYISNITEEKGIFVFLDMCERLSLPGMRALVAGPCDQVIRARFEERLAQLPNVSYLGPVYGGEKSQFYQAIDLLAFPSMYRNEADPVIVHEALSMGAAVVASDRGCLQEAVPEGCGQIVPLERWLDGAVDRIVESISATPSLRQHVLGEFERKRESVLGSRDALIDAIVFERGGVSDV